MHKTVTVALSNAEISDKEKKVISKLQHIYFCNFKCDKYEQIAPFVI